MNQKGDGPGSSLRACQCARAHKNEGAQEWVERGERTRGGDLTPLCDMLLSHGRLLNACQNASQ